MLPVDGVTLTVGVFCAVFPVGMTHRDTGMLNEDPFPERVIVPVYKPTANPAALTETLELPGVAPLVDETASHAVPFVLAVQFKTD